MGYSTSLGVPVDGGIRPSEAPLQTSLAKRKKRNREKQMQRQIDLSIDSTRDTTPHSNDVTPFLSGDYIDDTSVYNFVSKAAFT